jgi:capsular polysaccharide biosynthesis protein
MEFRDYWQIIWRRRNLIVPLVVVTFLASLIFNLVLPPIYKTDTTVYVQAIIPPVPPGTPEYFSREYYRTVYSEYLSDDLSIIVKSRSFAEKVADRLEARFGRTVAPKDVLDSVINTKRSHRTLKITIGTGSEALTKQIAEAMDDVLRLEGWRLFSTDERRVDLVVVDPPRDPTSPSVLRRLLEVLLHTGIALIAGTGIAFLLHYLDDRIQDENDAARTLAWPVLGAIPGAGPPEAGHPAPAGTGANGALAPGLRGSLRKWLPPLRAGRTNGKLRPRARPPARVGDEPPSKAAS